MPLPATRRLSGATLLRSVRDDLAPYRETLEPSGKQVAILRFDATQDDPPVRRFRMEAARVSAEQKVKAFSRLGLGFDHRLLSPSISAAAFTGLLTSLNADDRTAAIIVQFPPPPRLTPLVQQLAPAKDIDGLLEDRSQQRACATADGIARLVLPFAEDSPAIAVVGARGFVGRGVVRLLGDRGLAVRELDAGDDLSAAGQADIVVSATGQPHLLTPDHIRPHHRLVVDSGFMPRPDGSVAGDIHPDASTIPQYITPVPGGVGPVEMAVLMERIVRQEANPGLTAWAAPAMPYLTRGQVAARATSTTVRGSARPARTPPQAAPDHYLRQLPSPDRGRGGPSL
ncbi:bifunctional 5,10-methylenetetrahydrofolate dehydrogenase/5,10-methenyltetrahydrofolate cyclohydrolase [Streptomyces brevispora]|uniref:bifunctional 5,10-methylenetetrahydrofolate dehydrogenase/5,10-methenyltetrahydrofolate cyclohydrolase n=1 Tax=Streptomyces brevispora TaxID=887462 RepID=UPI002E30A47D|nr:bifunctional 5,10-methylenetetrahydrofolate dehydrogenase/5,10-methenyltetrahydrofolate cyclohydrolase [Streptomyces brevispora]